MRKHILSVVLTILVSAALPTACTVSETTTTPPTTIGEELKIHFIDVGQGDSILVDLGETEILIDGGGKSPGVVAYLNDHVDGVLEVMIATHPHADHIGGLIAVLGAFEVREIWHNNDISSSQTYAEFMAAVQAEGAEVQIGRRGDEINAGELTFTVLNPETLAGTTNDNSIVLGLSYGEVDFLFTGDAGYNAESIMLAAGIVPDIEILKVGHHGSRTASSPDFLEAARPETAIYMAGEGNSYGHPHGETIIALFNIGTEIYGTDVCGTIIITTDGKTYELQTESEGRVIMPTPSTTSTSPPATTLTQTPTSTPTPEGSSNVQITYIFHDGLVPNTEPDEYVDSNTTRRM